MLSRAVERSEKISQRLFKCNEWLTLKCGMLDSAGPFAKDMIKRLKYRRLMKNCLTRRMDELTRSNRTFGSFSEKF